MVTRVRQIVVLIDHKGESEALEADFGSRG
jgi:hypothetical protein